MSAGIRYGDVALGVESALPAISLPRRCGRVRRLFGILVAALKRWA